MASAATPCRCAAAPLLRCDYTALPLAFHLVVQPALPSTPRAWVALKPRVPCQLATRLSTRSRLLAHSSRRSSSLASTPYPVHFICSCYSFLPLPSTSTPRCPKFVGASALGARSTAAAPRAQRASCRSAVDACHNALPGKCAFRRGESAVSCANGALSHRRNAHFPGSRTPETGLPERPFLLFYYMVLNCLTKWP